MLEIKGVPRVKSMAKELLEEAVDIGACAVKLIFDHKRNQLVTALMFFLTNDHIEAGFRRFDGAMWEGAFRLSAKIVVVKEYDKAHVESDAAIVIEEDERSQVVRKHVWRPDGREENQSVWRSTTAAAGKDTASNERESARKPLTTDSEDEIRTQDIANSIRQSDGKNTRSATSSRSNAKPKWKGGYYRECTKNPCGNCGRRDHWMELCPTIKCKVCHEPGHTAYACPGPLETRKTARSTTSTPSSSSENSEKNIVKKEASVEKEEPVTPMIKTNAVDDGVESTYEESEVRSVVTAVFNENCE